MSYFICPGCLGSIPMTGNAPHECPGMPKGCDGCAEKTRLLELAHASEREQKRVITSLNEAIQALHKRDRDMDLQVRALKDAAEEARDYLTHHDRCKIINAGPCDCGATEILEKLDAALEGTETRKCARCGGAKQIPGEPGGPFVDVPCPECSQKRVGEPVSNPYRLPTGDDCPSRTGINNDVVCVRPKGHAGAHSDGDLIEWRP